ncbi:MAG: hypothetical protein ACLR0N_10240 [Bilophila wadsworthia]
MGALVFLGCPWRAILRLAGGDGNAILGLAGLATGIWFGTLFFKKGYSLGHSNSQSVVSGHSSPSSPSACSFFTSFSRKSRISRKAAPVLLREGPRLTARPLHLRFGLAFIIGIFAQRSVSARWARSATSSFRYTHLFLGLAAMFAAAFITNA